MSVEIKIDKQYFRDDPNRKMKKLTGFLVHDSVTSNWPKERVLKMVAHGVTQPKGFIPGPLYNVVIFEDGEVYQTASCRSNNAGKGDKRVLKAIQTNKPIPKRKTDSINGNFWFWGVCLARSGKKPIPKPMYDSLLAVLTHLCEEHNIPSHGILRHADWSKRKIDSQKLDIWKLRKEVSDNLKSTSSDQTTVIDAPTVPLEQEVPPAPPANADKQLLGDILKRYPCWKHNTDDVRKVQELTGANVDGIYGTNTETAFNNYFR